MQNTFHISAARAYILFFGGADGVYVRLAGFQVGPVAKGASDAETAVAVAAAINADSDASAVVTASADGPCVSLSVRDPGADGLNIDLDTEAVTSGATLCTPFHGGVSATFTF